MKFLSLLISFLFLSNLSFSQALSGSYTVGGSSPDFLSISTAVDQLNIVGVGEGGVEFLIRNGTYNTPLTISAQGTFANQIVFRSETDSPESVILTTVSSEDVITLDGAKYIAFDAITVSVVGNSNNSAFQLENNSDNVSISRCHLNGASSSSNTYAGAVIYCSESSETMNSDSILISNCLINEGTYGLAFSFGGGGANSIDVENCVFENQYAGAFYYNRVNAPMISNNRISTNQSGNTSYAGIDLNNCPGAGRIINNYIFSTESGRLNYGIQLNSTAGSAGNEFVLANNSIQVQNENSLCYALAQSNNCNHFKIFQNTLFISGGSSSGSSPYQTFTFNDDTDFYNNILVSASNGSSNRCVYIANQSGIGFIDYNVYWTVNVLSNFTGYFGSSINDFSSFSQETGEAYSLNIDPMMTFIEGGGWRATNELLLTTGLFDAEFNYDIDGNTRPDPPSIGAHEVDQINTFINNNEIQNSFRYSISDDLIIIPLNFEINSNLSYSIYDSSGRLIVKSMNQLASDQLILPVNSFPKGLSIIQIVSNNRISIAGKIILP
ncbi:MAG: hypothetical protein WED33_02080 [Bacteroidia bacterium]